MNIVVIGAGRIGSTIAFHLARAGHDVTVVARGERRITLGREGAIVAVGGERAPVRVVASLDGALPYDLAIVTVLRHQFDALLPALQASAAKSVLLMFNTFDTIDLWRAMLGADRFAFGFPNMTAFLVEGKLRSVVNGPGMGTTMSDARLVDLFNAGGLPAKFEQDMNGFLRSHVAFVVPMMVAAIWTWQRRQPLTRVEASRLAGALREGLELVRSLGHALQPGYVAVIAKLPRFALTALIWSFARTAAVRNLGEFGPDEVRALIDTMAAAVPGSTPKLLSIRP